MSGILFILAVLIAAAFVYLTLQYRQRDRGPSNRRNVFFTEEEAKQQPEPVETVRVIGEPVIEETNEPVIEVGAPEMSHVHHVEHHEPKPEPVRHDIPSSLMPVSVMAENGHLFSSYDLLQAITNAGFHFGEMNVFHRHEHFEGHGKVLFTLASVVKPGTFDLDNMGAFSTPGLSIFMDAAMHDDPKAVLNCMLDCAHQLAEELGGELCEVPGRPFDMDSYKLYEAECARALKARQAALA